MRRPTTVHCSGSCDLDCFAGTGVTGAVAESLGRDSILIDLGYDDLRDRRTDGARHIISGRDRPPLCDPTIAGVQAGPRAYRRSDLCKRCLQRYIKALWELMP